MISFGRSNTYEFKISRKRIALKPTKPKSSVVRHKTGIVTNKESKKPLHRMTRPQFAYNNSVNRSTDLSTFKIITGYKPRKPISLLLLPIGEWHSAPAESFTQHLHDLHDDIRRQIAVSNVNYKSAANLHKRLQELAIEDKVMVKVRPKRFPLGTVKKLHAQPIGPNRVLRRFGSNAYDPEIPRKLGINPVFNVEDMTPIVLHQLPQSFPVHPPPPPRTHHTEEIENILKDEIISIADGGYQRYLVRWRGWPKS